MICSLTQWKVCLDIASFLTVSQHIFHVNSVFDVPVSSSVIEEQLTRPWRETSTSHILTVLGLYSLKTGPSKRWKIFPLRNDRLRRGGGVKKEISIGRFA